MKRTRGRLISILTLLSLTFSTSYGCDCIGKSTVKQSIESSDIVITGKIISRELVSVIDSEMINLIHPDTSLYKNAPYSKTVAKYTVLIEEFYKGSSSDTILVYTGLGGGDCGFNFTAGEKYIIYGRKNTYFGQVNNKYNYPTGKNIYWTDICTRTTKSNDKELADIKTAILKKRKPNRC